ncbi:4841_t:CDS:2 [Funneliformis caledonium]|uniref:4841_t:CDS:1 n=1 Tax=Funneliformis caledonium TaxID=1117310 RepID=A0A9N9BCK5_9GLOM|nr:4841_t:CDS:2 [Funneliformis caledonium]
MSRIAITGTWVSLFVLMVVTVVLELTVKAVERNVRKWLDKHKRAARVITNAILAWYYRPDGPRMKIAEESFKKLIVDQDKNSQRLG